MELFNTEKFRNVPFGNSVFQIQHFTDGSETPERRYRHCLLQLNQKYNALKECEFRRARLEIDCEELEEKINNSESFEKRRFEIDLLEIEHKLNIELKLIEDCGIEVLTYTNILEQLPKFTREEFESSEHKYWETRLLGDVKNEMLSSGTIDVGTIKSLGQIGIDIAKNESGQLVYIEGDKNNDNILHIDKTNNV